MNEQRAIRLVKETFESPFDRNRYIYFLRELLNEFDGEGARSNQGGRIPEKFQDYVERMERVGKYTIDNHQIMLFIVYLKKETSIERARTMQRNFVAWYLDRDTKDAALVAFVSRNPEDWRFSLVKMDYRFEEQDGKTKVKEEYTPARRWSFLVGVNEKSHTAQSKFVPILEDDKNNPTLAKLEDAFNIEKVTKEFFEKYRDLFIRAKGELDKAVAANPKTKADFESKGIDTTNLAKKLLGQIIFLYFLQKKGWFGVPRDGEWGEGSKKFLRDLFAKKRDDENFFNDILEHLFYDALRNDRSHDDHYYGRFNCKIPFLNGGLFDPMNNYDWVHTDILLPDSLFSNKNKTKEGDEGNGILDIFDRYNFTVKEDEPFEKEVAIDPELLGKAYEKFNAIRPDNYDEFLKALKSGKKGEESKFNKQYGVYYTPREIVHYMCQQSLINYLHSELNPAVVYQSLGDDQLDMFGNKVKGGQMDLNVEHRPMAEVPKEAIALLIQHGESLREHEAQAVEKETKTYSPIIHESIRKNAALIDQKLAEIKICDPAVGSGAFPVGMMSEIVKARQTLAVYQTSEFSENSEVSTRKTVYDFKRECIENSLYGVDIDAGAVEIAKLRLWLSLIVDENDPQNIKPLPNLDYKIVCGNSLIGVEKNLFNLGLFTDLESLKPLYFNATNPAKKQEYKKKIDGLIDQITNGRVQFDFEIYFSEVFHEKGGFDVLIGNPPYYSLDTTDTLFKNQLQKIYSEVFSSQGNIYFFFIKKSMLILKKDGILMFINENYYLSNKNAQRLRKYLLDNSEIVTLIDFRNVQLFENVNTLTIINSFKKTLPRDNAILARVVDDSVKYLDSQGIAIFLTSHPYLIKQKELDQKQWLLISRGKSLLKARIDHTTTPLIDCVDMGQGMTSGNNKVFIVSNKQALELGLENDLLRKYVKTQDIKPYSILYRDLSLIYITKEKSVNKYPSIKKYLVGHKEQLLRRFEVKSDPERWFAISVQRNQSFFEEYDEKILTPLYSKGNKFAYDDCKRNNYFVLTDVYVLVPKSNNFALKYLLGLLNSKLLNYYVVSFGKLKRDGYYEYSKNTLSNLPIKKDTSYQNIIALVDRILEAKRANPQADTSELEKQIDLLVYELYGLTEEEIRIMEGKG